MSDREFETLISLSDKVFAKLMTLYPRTYRNQNQAEMALVFREISRDTYISDGPAGLIIEWAHTLVEMPAHALIERLDRLANRLAPSYLVMSGHAAILAGMNIGILTYINPANDGFPIWMAVIRFALSVLGISGIYLVQKQSISPTAVYGFLLMSMGVVFELLDLPTGMTSWLHLAGMLLIARTTIKSKKFSSIPAILWIASPVIGLPAFFFGGIEHILFAMGATVFGLGYMFFGFNILEATWSAA